MSAVEILRQARELIVDKGRWTQGIYARAADGCATYSTEVDAVCWCGVGALHRASDTFGSREARAAHNFLGNASISLFGDDVPQVNDGDVELNGEDPHAAVLRIYDVAIANAEAANA